LRLAHDLLGRHDIGMIEDDGQHREAGEDADLAICDLSCRSLQSIGPQNLVQGIAIAMVAAQGAR
jgi:hypothetical protein